MEDLIEALQILLKHGNPKRPTWCEHDVLHIGGIDYTVISKEDKARLEELRVYIDEDNEDIYSYRFGSA